jgi:hypothetical protein
MAVDRRKWWAGGAAAVLAALVIWSLGSEPPQATRTTPPRAGARAGREWPVEAPVAIHLERLAADRSGPADTRRNPFAFQARGPAPRPVVDAPASSPGPSPVLLPPQGPPPVSPIALKFIGIVESKGGVKLAVLTDGRVVSHGQVGDIIEGRYRILSIGVESIEMAHADGRGRQTIRLTGQ